jgi:hypothetical protein
MGRWSIETKRRVAALLDRGLNENFAGRIVRSRGAA